MLEIRELRAGYGANLALHDVSLTVGQGRIACLIGSNGAGKSTTLRTVCGIVRARGGSVSLAGTRIDPFAPAKIVKAGLALVPEGRRVFGPLSVDENLQMGAYLSLRERKRQHYDERLAFVQRLFPRLLERSRQLAGTLSGGEQQMLAIGRALMSGPRVLLLDEPSMGLAPLVVRDIFATLASLRDDGMTILIAEQNARAGLSIADDAYVITEGRITRSGTAAQIMQDRTLADAYLGTQQAGSTARRRRTARDASGNPADDGAPVVHAS
ncbi:ABC transporter ATP-binding protein (plasmid) [Paraburkholderia sp. PREW-6R]|uniref:ABC transporter ATP-binding protein n=1 Tax=Paraburkholderia sp. PREW-6R TaxID=3141544 RepID=UPI0031F4C904